MTKFYTLYVTDKDVPAWAARSWDTYGFDYDKERAAEGRLIVWPREDVSHDELKEAFDYDGIEFEEFEADPKEMFR